MAVQAQAGRLPSGPQAGQVRPVPGGVSARHHREIQREPTASTAALKSPRSETVRRPRPIVLPTLFVLLVIGAVVVAPLLLNQAAMRAEAHFAQLEERREDLMAERAELRTQVATLSSTQRVKDIAELLGMGQAARVTYVMFPEGTLLPSAELQHEEGPAAKR